MDGGGTTLVIPVEDQVREFDAKLLTACVAAERGFRVVLGSWTYVNYALPFLKRGVYIAKSMRPRNALLFRILHDLGHTVVAFDEESLVRFDSPEFNTWRYSRNSFRHLSQLFAWGVDDAELLGNYPGNNGIPVHVTGNPRIDLLRKELRGYFAPAAAALRERYGDFILVNTNFSSVNAFVPGFNLSVREGTGRKQVVSRSGKGLSPGFARDRAAHQQALFESFRALIPRLGAAFPDRCIIVRPHPTENHALWRDLLEGLDNVHVLHEGNVVPWLLACKVLVHNGCTTAVEGAVLDTPAVSYRPVTDERFDYRLPNSLSHQARTAAELLALVDDVVADRLGPVAAAQRRRVLERHLAATTGPLAADRVVDVLVNAGYGEALPPRPGAARYATAWATANIRTLVKHINRYRSGHWNSSAYHAHRFPELDVADVEERLHRLQAALGRFGGIRVERASRFIFRISDSAGRDAGVTAAA